MIEIDGKLLNPAFITYAEVDTVHYMNCSVSYLVVRLSDGTSIRKEHNQWFDAWKALDKIRKAQ